MYCKTSTDLGRPDNFLDGLIKGVIREIIQSDFLSAKPHGMKMGQFLCQPFKQGGFTATRRSGYDDVLNHEQ